MWHADHSGWFFVSRSGAGLGAALQLGPDGDPVIGAKLAASHRAARVPLDQNSQRGGARANAIHDVLQVTYPRLAL